MASKSMFTPRRFGHSNVFVSEVHRSMDFYHRVVGLQECFQEPAMHAGFMGNGNSHHDLGLMQISEEDILGKENHVLVPAGFGKKPGLFHLAYEVESEAELVEGYEKVVKGGVKLLMVVDHTLAKSVYMIDPEGNVIELTADATKDWRKTFRDHAGQLVTGPWTPGKEPPSTEKNYPVDPKITEVPDALMHTRRTTHPVLGCRDFAQQLSFYKNVVGLQEARNGAAEGVAVLRGTVAPCSLILFDANRSNANAGYHHTAYEVPSADLENATARLRASGVSVTATYDDRGKRSVFARDPDGLGIEFFAHAKGTEAPLATEAAQAYWMITA